MHWLSKKQITSGRRNQILGISITLVSSSDETVSSLYTPQDVDIIRAHIQEIQSGTEKLRLEMLDGTDALAERLEEIGLKDGTGSARTEDKERQWLQTCFAQIRKALNDLQER